jgi:hypothetical protein
MPAEIINLNKARKAREKAARDAEAKRNRAGFGRTKDEKTKALSMAERLKKALDDAKRDPDRS